MGRAPGNGQHVYGGACSGMCVCGEGVCAHAPHRRIMPRAVTPRSVILPGGGKNQMPGFLLNFLITRAVWPSETPHLPEATKCISFTVTSLALSWGQGLSQGPG